ncbi:hypothetical protein [Allomuricauda sp. d1]|uniref:hypothetical protein n=1 Tax=Allomuricauda sp. d1 TaxID=3136725 RepID=UPI0031DC7B9B
MSKKISKLPFFQRKKTDTTTADENISLISGTFTPSEAADILLSFLNDKIKFHTVRKLNLQPDSDTAFEVSEQRINDLRQAKERVTDLVVSAQKNGHLLDIKSTIEISLATNSN